MPQKLTIMPQKLTRLFIWVAPILDQIGIACFIVAIIGAAADMVLGLEATFWFLIAIGLWLLTIRVPMIVLVEDKKEK